jgi:hypothetical protein
MSVVLSVCNTSHHFPEAVNTSHSTLILIWIGMCSHIFEYMKSEVVTMSVAEDSSLL